MNKSSSQDPSTNLISVDSLVNARLQPASGAYSQSGYAPNNESEDEIAVRDLFRRRWKVLAAITLLTLLAAIAYCIFAPRIYEADATVLLQQPNQFMPGPSAYLSGQNSMLASMVGLNSTGDTSAQILIMLSDRNLSEVARRVGIDKKPFEMRKTITASIDKTAPNVVDIAVLDRSPQRAAQIAQTLIQVYTEQVRREDSTAVGRSALLARQQLNSVQSQLAREENALTAYSHRVGTIAPDVENSQRVQQLFAINSQILTAQQKLGAAKMQRDYYKKQSGQLAQFVVPSVSFAQNPRVEAAKARLNELEEQRAKLATIYTPQDDEMVQNQKQIDAETAAIVQERKTEQSAIGAKPGNAVLSTPDKSGNFVVSNATRSLNPIRENTRQSLIDAQANMEAQSAELSAAQNAMSTARQGLAGVPDKTRVFQDITANILTDRHIIEALRMQLADLEPRRGQEQMQTRVLEPAAVPTKPASPRVMLALLGALFGGLFLGLLAILGLYLADPKVRGSADIASYLRLPVLAVIPRLGRTGKSGTVIHRLDESRDDGKAFQYLACNLAYLGLGRSIKSILITSAASGEGVTLIASQLALTLAREGKRVILVDANMRRPSLHTLFDMANTSGLAGVMQEHSAPEQALVRLKSESTLEVIPSGVVDHDCKLADVLDRDRLGELIRNLEDRCDVVLVDAAAVFDGLETASIADQVDAIIFVAAVERSTREEADRAIRLLSGMRVPILGAVVNEFSPSSK